MLALTSSCDIVQVARPCVLAIACICVHSVPVSLGSCTSSWYGYLPVSQPVLAQCSASLLETAHAPARIRVPQGLLSQLQACPRCTDCAPCQESSLCRASGTVGLKTVKTSCSKLGSVRGWCRMCLAPASQEPPCKVCVSPENPDTPPSKLRCMHLHDSHQPVRGGCGDTAADVVEVHVAQLVDAFLATQEKGHASVFSCLALSSTGRLSYPAWSSLQARKGSSRTVLVGVDLTRTYAPSPLPMSLRQATSSSLRCAR